MLVRTTSPDIQDFLLTYIFAGGEDGEAEARRRTEVGRHVPATDLDGSVPAVGDTAEVATRCRACPTDESWPCRELRTIAAPYARHPAYQPEWKLDRTDSGGTIPHPRPPA